jgi:NADPH2:quinone reductase
MRAIRLERTGGPEVLHLVDLPTPEPGPGEIRVRHQAIGLNFIDTYQRGGLYPLPLPATLGLEAAGVVDAVGERVTRFQTGDLVGYNGSLGAYAEANVLNAARAVKLPSHVDARTAAASLLKGMTAEFLARRIWPLHAGDWVLVHAAAGGVGLILCQWLNHLGVRVIGTVGSEEKATLAKANGCAEVVLYRSEDVAKRVREITGGAGVKVAYDSVGASTVDASLNSLQPRGLFVSFGNASGPVPAIEPLRLSRGGSLFLTRPTLYNYIASTAELDESAAALFQVIGKGAVKIAIGQEFPLEAAAEAHRSLEGRATTGSTLLIP